MYCNQYQQYVQLKGKELLTASKFIFSKLVYTEIHWETIYPDN